MDFATASQGLYANDPSSFPLSTSPIPPQNQPSHQPLHQQHLLQQHQHQPQNLHQHQPQQIQPDLFFSNANNFPPVSFSIPPFVSATTPDTTPSSAICPPEAADFSLLPPHQQGESQYYGLPTANHQQNTPPVVTPLTPPNCQKLLRGQDTQQLHNDCSNANPNGTVNSRDILVEPSTTGNFYHTEAMPSLPNPSTSSLDGPNQDFSSSDYRLSQSHDKANGSESSKSKDLDMLGLEKTPSDDEDNGSGHTSQSRRKAQNRAAQRAFRERKAMLVKDLEDKVAQLKAAQQEAERKIESLERNLDKAHTENEILRTANGLVRNGQAASSSGASGDEPSELDADSLENLSSPRALMTSSSSSSPASQPPLRTGPMKYTPTDFYETMSQGHPDRASSHRIVQSSDGQRLLAIGAMWDFMVATPAYRNGLLDVAKVSLLLRDKVVCDGQGPVFPEKAIHVAIQQSIQSSDHELL